MKISLDTQSPKVRSYRVLWPCLVTLLLFSPSFGAEDPIYPVIQRTDDLRTALGYDLQTLAALEVSSEQYAAIASAALSVAQPNGQLTQLVADYHTASQARPAAAEKAETFTSAVDN